MRLYDRPKYGFYFDESKRTSMPDEIYIGTLSKEGSIFDESKRIEMPKEIYLGSIWIDNDILNESLGKLKLGTGNANKFDAKVLGREGAFPHFHLKSLQENKNCAILLFDNMYFTHKSARYVFKRDKKIYQIIDEFLRSTNKETGESQWITAINKYLAVNPKPSNLTYQECYSIPYPDYSKEIKSYDIDRYNNDLGKILGRKITGGEENVY